MKLFKIIHERPTFNSLFSKSGDAGEFLNFEDAAITLLQMHNGPEMMMVSGVQLTSFHLKDFCHPSCHPQ